MDKSSGTYFFNAEYATTRRGLIKHCANGFVGGEFSKGVVWSVPGMKICQSEPRELGHVCANVNKDFISSSGTRRRKKLCKYFCCFAWFTYQDGDGNAERNTWGVMWKLTAERTRISVKRGFVLSCQFMSRYGSCKHQQWWAQNDVRGNNNPPAVFGGATRSVGGQVIDDCLDDSICQEFVQRFQHTFEIKNWITLNTLNVVNTIIGFTVANRKRRLFTNKIRISKNVVYSGGKRYAVLCNMWVTLSTV